MLDHTLDHFFTETAPLGEADRLLVAFSGGPDSTALLSAAARLGRRRGFEVVAAHLDHALDEDSARRAERARALAASIGVLIEVERVDPEVSQPAERGLEDWARRVRYDFLERQRRTSGARYVATGHHRDDQIETVLLRILHGSGLEGLGAIEPRRDDIVRPLLELGRAEIATELVRSDLEAIEDPTNRDPRRPRNLVRDHLAPHLTSHDKNLDQRLVGIAAQTRRLSKRLVPLLSAHLDLSVERDFVSLDWVSLDRVSLDRPSSPGASSHRSASLDLERFRTLPDALRPFALSLLHRTVASPYPAGEPARRELERQIDSGAEIGSDCGQGWRWERQRMPEAADRLVLRRQVEASVTPFAYTLPVPGEVAIPELELCVSIAREPVAAWMFEGHPLRAALVLPIEEGDRLIVRNRQPGDRLQPLGCGYRRRLKEVFIDAGVPREQRDRVPLLCIENQIAWIPGLTIDESFRIKNQTYVWIARIESMESPTASEPDGECHSP